MLRLNHVKKRFDNFVLQMDLSVRKGEFISLLGPSGCGKTTVLRLISGLELPDEGEVLLDGRPVTKVPPGDRGVGMVFQDFALFPHMSVLQNVEYGLKRKGRSNRECHNTAQDMLAMVGLSDMGDRHISTLSGGEKQRVALARSLVLEPKVLLLDEPFSALDQNLRASLRREIRRLQRKIGITTVFVTHNQEEALSLSDQIVVMGSGKIVQQGTPLQIYDNPVNSYVANFVGEANLLKPWDAPDMTGGGLLLVRPEWIGISVLEDTGTSDENVPHNRLSGVVEDVEYLGFIASYRVRTAAGDIKVLSSVPVPDSSIMEGTSVDLTIKKSVLIDPLL